ncbi:MAG: response regulator [Planctomycetota bacterium]
MKVLLVEDNPVNRQVTLRALSELGYQVDVVVNGGESLRAAAATEYDAILMDCRMPEMDGFAATMKIRQQEGGLCHTPIIALTSHDSAEHRERCFEAGMDDFLTRPIDLDRLRKTLEAWVG